MIAVRARPVDIPVHWSEEAIRKALADGTVNQKDEFGIPPLAAAMLEAHCAWGEESAQHWIKRSLGTGGDYN